MLMLRCVLCAIDVCDNRLRGERVTAENQAVRPPGVSETSGMPDTGEQRLPIYIGECGPTAIHK